MSSRSATERLAPARPPVQLRPAVAIVTFALVVLALARFGASSEALGAVFLLCVAAVLAVVDLEERRIPNRIVLPATAAALVAQIALAPGRTPELIAISLAAGLFFFLPMLLFPQGMGMGDVKFAVLLGAALGKAVALAIAVTVLAAGFVALAVLFRHGPAARNTAIPYGPFLALGAAVAIFFG